MSCEDEDVDHCPLVKQIKMGLLVSNTCLWGRRCNKLPDPNTVKSTTIIPQKIAPVTAPTPSPSAVNEPACRARIYQKVGANCDTAPPCSAWGHGNSGCCGPSGGACGPSGGPGTDFVSTNSGTIMGLGSCNYGDFIRVSAGCGIEVYGASTQSVGLKYVILRDVQLWPAIPVFEVVHATLCSAH